MFLSPLLFPHPQLTKEKFVATATFERQMTWMQDSLLPKVPTQNEAQKDLSVQAVKVRPLPGS